MKKLDVTQVLTNFNGEPLKEGDRVLTLKDMLLAYLSNAHLMECDNKTAAYCAGVAIATGGKECKLEQDQYDAVKKLADNPQITDNQGNKKDFASIIVTQQVKKMVDNV
jgi:hypothetical protein